MYKRGASTSTTNPKFSQSISEEDDDEKRERASQLYREDSKKTFEKKKREKKVSVLRLSRLPDDRPMICLHVDTGLRRSQFEKSGKLGRIDDAGQLGPI